MTSKELMKNLEGFLESCKSAKVIQILVMDPPDTFIDGLDAVMESLEDFIDEQKTLID